MDITTEILLIGASFLAGLIDSVAGGGGLITVPLLSLLIGPGAIAIGTNKVAAVGASLLALLVYMRGGHVVLKGHRSFALLVGLGAILGSQLSPYIPSTLYRWLLIIICPTVLWIVYRKDFWIGREMHEVHGSVAKSAPLKLWLLGFGCGFYDGLAGPGGGTLMFLSLYLVARIPLLSAMATAKVANLTSASLALASFSWTGNVRWKYGLHACLGISIGAAIGAFFALRNAAPLARAALLLLGGLLFLKLLTV